MATMSLEKYDQNRKNASKKAKKYIAESLYYTSKKNAGEMTESEYFEKLTVLNDELDRQPTSVQAAFCREYVSHIKLSIKMIGLIDQKNLKNISHMFNEDVRISKRLYNKISDKLQAYTPFQINYLRNAFNNLPDIDKDNPQKSAEIFLNAAKLRAPKS